MNHNKIKILRILNRFNLGGPVYNATYLTKYLDKNKYHTFLVGGIPENHEKSADYILNTEGVSFKKLRYMRRSISPFLDIISFIQILYIMYTFKPDILHTHAAKAGFIGRVAAIFYFKKLIVIHTFHGNVFDGYFSKFKTRIILSIERFLARISTKIIAISELQKRDLVDVYSICPEKKIEVVPLGFDLKKFTINNTKKRKNSREEFNILNDEVLITIIGRLVPIKNHKFFIDVFKNCLLKSRTKIKALVVGDGPEIENIIAHTKSLGLSYSYKVSKSNIDVFFSSWRTDIDNILSASDIVCLTSKNEGTPVSIIESMASQTASISTDVGGVSNIIDNNINGLIVDDNISKFSENLIKLIDDKSFRDKLAFKGRNKSLRNYDVSILSKNISKLYCKLLKT